MMDAHTKGPQIDAPELLTGSQRTRDTLFTAFMWVAYLYLWAPLVSLFAWWLGFEYAYDVMVRSGGGANLVEVLSFYAIVIGVIFVTVTTWSLGNRFRYGHLQRRHMPDSLTLELMADDYGVSVELVETLRREHAVTVEFSEEGLPLVAGQGGEDFA